MATICLWFFFLTHASLCTNDRNLWACQAVLSTWNSLKTVSNEFLVVIQPIFTFRNSYNTYSACVRVLSPTEFFFWTVLQTVEQAMHYLNRTVKWMNVSENLIKCYQLSDMWRLRVGALLVKSDVIVSNSVKENNLRIRDQLIENF